MHEHDETAPDEALAVLGAVRRCLEDVIAFEGSVALLPPGGAAGTAGRAAGAPGAAVPAPGQTCRGAALEALRREICTCSCCRLASSRRRFVFGAGAPDAGIMFIGEAPGEEEDLQGEPFVGAAGQLLTRIIEAMKLRREQVYIANAVKCRPPGNRDPREDELAACAPHLRRQIAIVRPRVLCTLGRVAAQALLRTDAPLGRLRGRLHEYDGIPVICTYHPAALLRQPEYKRPTWEDVKWLRQQYDGVQL